MSSELETKIVEIFPELADTPSYVSYIEGALLTLSRRKLDFPHQMHHPLRVYRDAQVIATLLGLSKSEHELLLYGTALHDSGRIFVEGGLIKEEEHQDASFVIAKATGILFLGMEEELADHFAEGVALHTEDVLPQGVATWIRVLRDADRTSRIGAGGLIEAAWFLGYRDNYLENLSPERAHDDGLIYDASLPVTANQISEYDKVPKEYFDENVLPWIMEKKKLGDLVKTIHMFMGRIYGVPSEGGDGWIVEPVVPEAQFLVAPRVKSVNEFLARNQLSQISVMYDLKKTDI